jgi:hypothetical protein
VGFEPRQLPHTPQWGKSTQPTNGILAPACSGRHRVPAVLHGPVGARATRGGAVKFMRCLNTVLPVWMTHPTWRGAPVRGPECWRRHPRPPPPPRVSGPSLPAPAAASDG